MKLPNFFPYEFVAAAPFNAAFGAVSGSIVDADNASWAYPGLISPETMTVGIAGNTATIGLPAPFGILSSGGVLVHAHGTLTNQDTTNYSVNFASLVPGSGTSTAYVVASLMQIQQTPITNPGPPPSHPSYDPNFVPGVGYANNVYSIALTPSATAGDNVTTFNLYRTTLTAGQGSLAPLIADVQVRATNRLSSAPLYISTSLVLTPVQLHRAIVTYTANLTVTLPPVVQCIGDTVRIFNESSGNLTVACQGSDGIGGLGNYSGSIVLPSAGTVSLYASDGNSWRTTGFNNSSNNVWTGTNYFNQGVVAQGYDPGGYGQFRAVQGNYGVIWRNDGSNYYLLSTPSGGPYGTWNAYRPFTYNLGNGAVTIDGTGAGTSFGGNVSTSQGFYAAYVSSTGNINAAGTYTGGAVSVNGVIQTPSTVQGGYVYSTGNMAAAGQFNSNTVYTNYLYSYGALQVNGSAAINGNLSVGNQISSNTVYSNYIHSYGTSDAAGDVNAGGNMHCQGLYASAYLSDSGPMDVGGYVHAGQEIQTQNRGIFGEVDINPWSVWGYTLWTDGAWTYLRWQGGGWWYGWNTGNGDIAWNRGGGTAYAYLDASGNFYVNGVVVIHWGCDERIKKDVEPFVPGLSEIVRLKPKKFRYNGEGGSPKFDWPQYGCTAQELQLVIPEAVYEQASRPLPSVTPKDEPDPGPKPEGHRDIPVREPLPGQLAVDEKALLMTCINAIRELNDKVEAQANEIAELKRAA